MIVLLTFLFGAGAVAVFLIMARSKTAPDGTPCGSVAAHRWKYVHEQCMGRQELKCTKCGIYGMLEPGNDEDRYDISLEGMFLHPYINEEVHYTDGQGTCRICRLP